MTRIVTSKEIAKRFSTKPSKLMVGKVSWYDHKDAQGLIKGSDGRHYIFSMGNESNLISASVSNYVIDGSVLKSGDLVEFKGVSGLACDIKKK